MGARALSVSRGQLASRHRSPVLRTRVMLPPMVSRTTPEVNPSHPGMAPPRAVV